MERALASGASLRAVAREHKLSYHSLWRHWTNHVSPEQRARYIAGPEISKDRLAKAVADESLSIIDHLRIVRGALYGAFDTAISVGDRLLLDRIAGRLHENLRDCARLTGELRSGFLIQNNNISISESPDFARACAAIIGALGPYPDARSRVIEALRALDRAAVPAIEHVKSPECITSPKKAIDPPFSSYAAPTDCRTEAING
jgi:hypothetical protein